MGKLDHDLMSPVGLVSEVLYIVMSSCIHSLLVWLSKHQWYDHDLMTCHNRVPSGVNSEAHTAVAGTNSGTPSRQSLTFYTRWHTIVACHEVLIILLVF